MSDRLNFSPQPFRSRSALLLAFWVLNLALLVAVGACAWFWLDLREHNQDTHDDIDRLKSKQHELGQQNDQALKILQGIDTKTYRTQVRLFYEIQTAFQTHWGKMLDQLAEVMPEDVRLRELRPLSARGDGGVRETKIHLLAEARNKQAQLDFIRALQAHQAFQKLSLESESYGGEVAVAFELSFDYTGGP